MPIVARRVPEQTLEEILRRADIAGVIGRYLQLRPSGRKFLALCPFHTEKTPSFNLDPEKGLWYCFGCQEGGSLFQFLMKMEGLSFFQAVKQLAGEVGVRLELEEEGSRQDSERERALNLLERVANYYHELLLRSPLGRPAREYLEGRGLDREVLERFRLGWAPGGGQALVRKLEGAGFSLQEGIRCGVLRDRGGRVADRLQGRITFPICDTQGRVLAFGGRTLGEAVPKYLNTPETSYYSKRHHLYGLNLARGPISRADEAILVEGYLDVIALHRVGLDRAVACLGTSLTPQQVALLRRYARNAVLAYDSDRAGQAATVKGIDLFEQAGLRVRIARLPAGEDPDSLVRRSGRAGMELLVAGAVGVVEFHMERMEKEVDLSTPEGKEDYAREVLAAVGKVRDEVRRDAYVRALARRLGVNEVSLSRRLGRAGREGEVRRFASPGLPDTEVRLLRLCAAHPEWIGAVREILDPEAVSRDDLRPLFTALLDMEGRSEPLGVCDLLPYLGQEGMAKKLTEILVPEPLESTEEDARKYARAIQDGYLRRRLEALRKEVLPALEAGTLGPEDERYEEYMRLQRHFGRGANEEESRCPRKPICPPTSLSSSLRARPKGT